jgi:SOS-response transcriptional repressor LexA
MSASPLLDAIVAYAVTHGRAPTREQIHTAANFTQPGGITRLCEALEAVAQEELKRRTA